jgi:hypothetical protein
MVLNATFNNISIISWRSDVLVQETGGPGGNMSLVTDKSYLCRGGHIVFPIRTKSQFCLEGSFREYLCTA